MHDHDGSSKCPGSQVHAVNIPGDCFRCSEARIRLEKTITVMNNSLISNHCLPCMIADFRRTVELSGPISVDPHDH
eukprot:764729-Hanusia_phi.AAC.2